MEPAALEHLLRWHQLELNEGVLHSIRKKVTTFIHVDFNIVATFCSNAMIPEP